MWNVTRVVRWAALVGPAAIAGMAIYPVVGEFFISLAREQGWYEKPTDRVDHAVSTMAVLTGHPLFPWLGGISFGFAIGAWLDVILRRFQRKRPSERQRAFELGQRCLKQAAFIRRSLDRGSALLYGRDLQPVYAETASLFIDVEKSGIPIPKADQSETIQISLGSPNSF